MPTETRHFLLGHASPDDLARAVRVAGATVTFEQRADMTTSFSLPVPAHNASLEFRWIDEMGKSIPGFVALRSASDAEDAPGLCRFEVDGGSSTRPRVRTSGAQIFAELRVQNADFVSNPNCVELLNELDAGPDAVIEGIILKNLTVKLNHGEARVRILDDFAAVQQMSEATVTRYRDDQSIDVRGYLTASHLDDVSVEVQDGARLERCNGTIRVRRCLGAIIGSSRNDRQLVLAEAFDAGENPAEALRGAVLMDVAIDPTSISVFVAASEKTKVFDPIPASIADSLDGLPADERATAAELLHDRLGELAKRPSTVDAAATTVLELRRKTTQKYGLDWFLLTLAWLFGYGRLIARPLVIWTMIVVLILAFRLGAALEKPEGGVYWNNGIHVTDLSDTLRKGGDILLTTVLLPISWNGSTDSGAVSERVGVSGGYLIGVRVLMLVSLLAAGNAARRRIRVRPSSETS